MVDQCPLCCSVYVAPATRGAVQLDHTIPDLLDMGCTYDYGPSLHQWTSQGWQAYTYREFRAAADEVALGLKALGLVCGARGCPRIGLLLESDIHWALMDMGSAIASLITVPIDQGYPVATIGWIATDADLDALVISTWDQLKICYQQIQQVKLIVVVEDAPPPAWALSGATKSVLTTLAEIRRQGRLIHSPKAVQALKKRIHPEDLATIVYTAAASGQLKGVLLSHQNLTGNSWAAFSSMPRLMPGTPEVALSFLPLNHIFARAFLYGHFGFGHHVYFSSPKRVFFHLATVKPTIFITVPRLLEKVYERVNRRRQQSLGWQQYGLNWGWHLAHRPGGWWLQRWLLGRSVFKPLHRAFGGNIRYLLCGGAALRPEIMTFFNGVGLPVKQGYGLTETSSVVSYTRGLWLRAGTVGVPIPGVELRLAADGEVLVHSPFTMAGYHHNPAATTAVLDADGWFHTGDLGEFSQDGLLILHGCKKSLFKLSTGKYVAPIPVEAQLESSPLVQQALLVGPGQKFCGVLIVPGEALLRDAQGRFDEFGLAQLQTLIDQVNSHLSHWSTIKRFALIEVTGAASVSRERLYQVYVPEIKALYREAGPRSQALPRRGKGGTRPLLRGSCFGGV